MWQTVEEWNEQGMMVRKGSKCELRDPEGKCLFGEHQVKDAPDNGYRGYSRPSSGYYAQQGGNYQKHDYDYDDYDLQ